jgi:hypothetical protein
VKTLALTAAFISFIFTLWVVMGMLESNNSGVWWIITYLASSATVYYLGTKEEK